MGLLFGWMVYRSGSIVPSILLHSIHNSTLLFVVQSRDLLAEWNIGQVEQSHLPWPWLAVSAGVLGAGLLISRLVTKHTQVSTDTAEST